MMMNFFGNNKNKLKQRQLKQKNSDEDGGSSSKTDDIENNNGGGENQQVIDESFEVKQQQSDGNEMQRRVKSGSKMVYIVLAFAAVSFGFATYVLLSAAKEQEFRSEFSSYARETADLAENNALNTFGQLRTLATAITIVAETHDVGHSFPNLTIPHFDLRAEEIAELTGAEMILFVPFVEESERPGFESYAVQNQYWIEEGYNDRGWNTHSIQPIQSSVHTCTYCENLNDTRKGFVDSEGFMEDILKNKTSLDTDGLSVPILQYGPKPSADASLALMDLWTHPVFKKEIVASLEYDVPVISEITDLDFLLDHLDTTRHYPGDHNEGMNYYKSPPLRSFTLDQVKEGFTEDSRTVGYLVGVVQWKTFFQNLLPEPVNGVVVIVESDCGSQFTYVVNGGKDDWSAEGDHHDPKYDHMAERYKFFWKEHPKGSSRHCHFDLVVYPSDDFHAAYKTNAPLIYAGMVVAVFIFTAIVFRLYDVFVYRRHKTVLLNAQNLVIENAKDSARKERELNDFIAHEVRNPLAAAMSACSFVSSAVLDETSTAPLLANQEQRKSVAEDLEIIDSSLGFINDLLRNMLDIHRASTKQLNIEKQPTHLLNDVLKPVDCMLHRRGASFEVKVECPSNLIVLADKLRLKQIMLNLARNSVKFVEKGFIRLKAGTIEDGTIQLSVEDSGPGIPEEKREHMFARFQESLDSLHQGTGIGLSLCKQLADLMGGKLYIDQSYDSGIPGCPGARFVVDLKVAPMEWDDSILDEYSDHLRKELEIKRSNHSTSVCSIAEGSEEAEFHEESEASMQYADLKDPVTKPKPKKKIKELPEHLQVLFVDDDMVLRKLFCRSVKKIAPGWTLKEASNGETALSMTEAGETFDVIFMDQYMASVQKQLLGTETVRALRAQGVKSKICGLSANDVEQAFFEAGADSFMIKPFPCKPEAMKLELLRVLNNQRMTTSLGGSTSSFEDLATLEEGVTSNKVVEDVSHASSDGREANRDDTAKSNDSNLSSNSLRISMTGEVC